MKKTVLILLLTVTGVLLLVSHGQAQEQPAVEKEIEKQVNTGEKRSEEQAEEEELKPEVFIPTDELSEDKDIAFPTNI